MPPNSSYQEHSAESFSPKVLFIISRNRISPSLRKLLPYPASNKIAQPKHIHFSCANSMVHPTSLKTFPSKYPPPPPPSCPHRLPISSPYPLSSTSTTPTPKSPPGQRIPQLRKRCCTPENWKALWMPGRVLLFALGGERGMRGWRGWLVVERGTLW